MVLKKEVTDNIKREVALFRVIDSKIIIEEWKTNPIVLDFAKRVSRLQAQKGH